jgi:hypothetical protein
MESDEKQEQPEHMTLMAVAAKGYRYYIQQLKRGKKSGISGIFGSAEEILTGTTPPPKPLRDAQQPAADQFEARSLFLAYIADNGSRRFLDQYVVQCRLGKFGDDVLAKMTKPLPAALLCALSKEMSCVMIYLILLDQGHQHPAPDWLMRFFGAALRNTDRIAANPTAQRILETHTTAADYGCCASVARDICKQLAIQNDLAEEAIADFLLAGGDGRRELLQRSLDQPFDTISTALAQAEL